MVIDVKLRQEVIDLYNNLFTWQIDQDEKIVSTVVMFGIVGLYLDMCGSPLESASYAQECMDKIKDENKKLEICKKLLQGDKVRIPGMHYDFGIWGVFYDISTGEKIDRNNKKDKSA